MARSFHRFPVADSQYIQYIQRSPTPPELATSADRAGEFTAVPLPKTLSALVGAGVRGMRGLGFGRAKWVLARGW